MLSPAVSLRSCNPVKSRGRGDQRTPRYRIGTVDPEIWRAKKKIEEVKGLNRAARNIPAWVGGAGKIDANEAQNGREWFEYRRLKWGIRVCRKGWEFIGKDDRYPTDILAVPYGCHTRRPSK